MRMNYLLPTALLLASACVPSLSAQAVFSVANGGITIDSQNTTGGLSTATPFTVSETMTASGTLALSDQDGDPLRFEWTATGHGSGAWISKSVTNATGVAWTSFELELQQILGTASGEGDGLSFAQGGSLTFTSSHFSGYTRQDLTRDYLNFSGGIVNAGETVNFMFAVTDNSPTTPIYLAQIANKVDAPVGVPDSGQSALLVLVGLSALLGFRRKLC
jgi:hypothetical protein